MRIGGFQKVSLIDYPGQISAIVFTQGCNFRCPYCHNPELVDPGRYQTVQDSEDILAFLRTRVGKLDAVTLTGGEPTLQEDLPDFIRGVRAMGYLVKLDTNGSRPEVLRGLIEGRDIDYVAMDIKAPRKQYATVTRANVEMKKIRQSIDMIMSSEIAYEFRTTAVPSLVTRRDLVTITREIKQARRYVVQRFVPGNVVDGEGAGRSTFTVEEMKEIKEDLEKYIPHVMIRC